MLKKIGHTRAVDFYSLGAFLYELLTGIAPFMDESRARLYKRIQTEKIVFPSYLSASACDLISKLMTKNPCTRLGSHRGMSEIKSHSWCSSLSWDRFLTKSIDPPFPPQLRASNFDSEYTTLPVEWPECDVTQADYDLVMGEAGGEHFAGFEYPKAENLLETSCSLVNLVPKGKNKVNDLSFISQSAKATIVIGAKRPDLFASHRNETLYIPELVRQDSAHTYHSSVEISLRRSNKLPPKPSNPLFGPLRTLSECTYEESRSDTYPSKPPKKHSKGPSCKAVKLQQKNMRPGDTSESPSDSSDTENSMRTACYMTSP